LILLFDVGNSTIGIAVVENMQIVSNFRLTTSTLKTYDEYYSLIKEMIDTTKVVDIAITSVVPRITEQLIKMSKKHFKLDPFVLKYGVKTGINVKTDAPKEVGSDLICDAAGLDDDKPCLILDLGTANKFLYCENNAILGAIITPGVAVSQKALVNSTALLPDVELAVPKKVLGNNSVNCIQSGITYGTAAQIDGLISLIREEVKTNFSIIGTGGLASIILPLCKEKITRDSLLVFKGLLKIYYKNLRSNNER